MGLCWRLNNLPWDTGQATQDCSSLEETSAECPSSVLFCSAQATSLWAGVTHAQGEFSASSKSLLQIPRAALIQSAELPLPQMTQQLTLLPYFLLTTFLTLGHMFNAHMFPSRECFTQAMLHTVSHQNRLQKRSMVF